MDCYGLYNLCYGLVDALVMDNCIMDALVICDSCGKYMIFVVCQIEMQKTKKGKKYFAERIYHSARQSWETDAATFPSFAERNCYSPRQRFF